MRMTMKDKEARGLIGTRDIMVTVEDTIKAGMMTQAQVIKTHLMTRPQMTIKMTVIIHSTSREDIIHS